MSARYPSTVATEADLKVAANRLTTVLRGSVSASDTVWTLADASRVVANMLLSIDSEIVSVDSVSSNNVTVTRGFDGTTAAAHSSGRTVSAFITAWHHDALVDEVVALEAALGANLSNVSTGGVAGLLSTSYDFAAQTPGGSLIVGANVITLAPVPPGVNGTNTGHRLYIYDGSGTPESVLISGGTAVSGAASGTVIVTCANTHSGAWKIKSATAGIQEAIRSVSVSSGYDAAASIRIPSGKFPIYGTITNDTFASIIGAGSNSSILQKAFTTGDLIYIGDSGSSLSGIGGMVKDLTIQPLSGVTDTSGYAIRARLRYNPTIENVTIYGDAGIGRISNGVKFDTCLTFSMVNVKILDVKGVGLELTATSPDQCTGRILSVDVTGTTNVTGPLVYFHGNILSMFIDGLQIQGGLYNWQVITTNGAFSESQISNIIFDSAAGTAYTHSGTGATFKLNFANICLSTVSGVPSTMGMVFDGSAASVFTNLTLTNVTGGVNASNQIGTALFLDTVTNFLLGNSQIQGAGAGVGDTAIQIQGVTANIVLDGNEIGHSDAGGITGSHVYRAVYVPSGTHVGMTITGNRIYGSSAAIGIAGAHTDLAVTGNNLDVRSGATTSFTGTGTAYFDNLNDPAGLNGARNYIATEGGVNNAITGTLSGATLAAGLRVRILLAHTLQAGANTFALNGGATKAIKSHLNVANNIAAAYAVGSVIDLWYDGTQWQDLSQ